MEVEDLTESKAMLETALRALKDEVQTMEEKAVAQKALEKRVHDLKSAAYPHNPIDHHLDL